MGFRGGSLRARKPAPEGGHRYAWALNLLRDVLLLPTVEGGNDDAVLHSATAIQTALRERLALVVLEPLWRSRQMLTKALRTLRALLSVLPAGSAALAAGALPRFGRREPGAPLTRQLHVISSDALPAGVLARCGARPWVEALFRDILERNRDCRWRTSATARQELSLCHRFLRSTDWLGSDEGGLAGFHARMRGLSPAQLGDVTTRFLETLCHSEASAQRYRHVLRLLFVRYLGILTEQQFTELVVAGGVRGAGRRVVLETPADLEVLSERGRHDHAPNHDRTFHFSLDEEDALRCAAAAVPRDRLMLELLLTTGLRRRGLLNVLLTDVAERDGPDGLWSCAKRSWVRTLTKRRRQHTFVLHPPARAAIEHWLNTPESGGGRPLHPSPFLLPSGRTDDGQLGPGALSRAFKRLCERAGIPASSGRCHLHALRHTHAHRLRDAHNDERTIGASLGHTDPRTTRLYLRDSTTTLLEGMTLPDSWRPPHSAQHNGREIVGGRRVLEDWKRSRGLA